MSPKVNLPYNALQFYFFDDRILKKYFSDPKTQMANTKLQVIVTLVLLIDLLLSFLFLYGVQTVSKCTQSFYRHIHKSIKSPQIIQFVFLQKKVHCCQIWSHCRPLTTIMLVCLTISDEIYMMGTTWLKMIIGDLLVYLFRAFQDYIGHHYIRELNVGNVKPIKSFIMGSNGIYTVSAAIHNLPESL